MSAVKHTPGPWYAMTAETGGLLDQATVFSEHETDGEPTYIADTMPIDEEVPLEQRKANAHLIAAAPDLLVIATHPVLEHIIAESDHPSVKVILEPMRRAAIAKATGGTP